MKDRFQDIDWIGVALWIFRAVIILLVIYGIIQKLFFGAGVDYDVEDWVNFLGLNFSQNQNKHC